MSGPKRNADKINSIGIVVVGICGAVLVYVSIVALQAFYMDDSSDIQTMADYGGQDTNYKTLRAKQIDNLKKYEPKAAPGAPKPGEAAAPQLYTVSIDDAIRLVVESAKQDPSNLVPAIGPAVHPSIQPIYGRPNLMPAPAPGGSAAPAEGGSAAPAAGDAAGAAGGTVPAGSPDAAKMGPAGEGAVGAPPAAPAPAPAQPKKG